MAPVINSSLLKFKNFEEMYKIAEAYSIDFVLVKFTTDDSTGNYSVLIIIYLYFLYFYYVFEGFAKREKKWYEDKISENFKIPCSEYIIKKVDEAAAKIYVVKTSSVQILDFKSVSDKLVKKSEIFNTLKAIGASNENKLENIESKSFYLKLSILKS